MPHDTKADTKADDIEANDIEAMDPIHQSNGKWERAAARTTGHALRPAWLGLLCLATACGATLPPPEATPRERFEWSKTKFEHGKYHAALRGFRDLLFRDPLAPDADSARIMMGEAYLKAGEELQAVSEFTQFYQTRPNSALADEAQLGVCRAYWQLAPSLPRDQEFTYKAIEECTRLLEFFPRSPLVPDARKIVQDAREKAAAKELRTGAWYHKHGLLESAIIYLERVVRTYPEAKVMPQVLYLLYDSYTQVGFDAEAATVRESLLTGHADSEEARRLRESESEGED